ncbi:helix-turn-helix domain-containing protein [Streptomyces roseicoloratus]|uniref:helix-turn-helix domain-containing protein n=1 Tax=Streptomyces roseicoloratus TaxID=2508722 RepID=UPI0013E9571F|nr:helix-turn-helix domain-containing protein [Streptomyces roseicoloratus]
MGNQNTSVRPYASSRNGGKNHPHRCTRGGVIHEHTRHTERFTVIGNHLVQHPELSGLAIGIGAHIQSLPTGSPVDIKTIAARMREGTTRTAAAMRELEKHGYLRRTRERLPNGRIVTRTVFCNQPRPSGVDSRSTRPDPKARPEPQPRPEPKPEQEPKPKPKPEPEQAPRPAQTARPEPRRRALPAVPQPAWPAPDLVETAHAVLARLRLEDRRLLLSGAETEHLVPGVVAWLERDVSPQAVHHALTSDLPREPLYRPAAFLAHRLTDRLPPAPPFRAPEQPLHPLQNCDTCDRAFRAPEPGRCSACTAALGESEA